MPHLLQDQLNFLRELYQPGLIHQLQPLLQITYAIKFEFIFIKCKIEMELLKKNKINLFVLFFIIYSIIIFQII